MTFDAPKPIPLSPQVAQPLTRETLQDGILQRLIARHAPSLQSLTNEEREASMNATLAARPDPDDRDGAWLFAYGSLVWNPAFHFSDRRVARIRGWSRKFCLSTPIGRGSPDNPGLLLGLDRGGSCSGVAYRIAGDVLTQELSILWRREMLSGSYIPRWVALYEVDDRDERPKPFAHAITFTIDPASPSYCGEATDHEKIRRLATAAGLLGSSKEYLVRTRDGLREVGIVDPEIERFFDAISHLDDGAAG